MLQYLWLILLVVFIVAEWLTVGLVSIWFAGGALAALLFAVFGAGQVAQVVVFLVVSAALLIGTRPFAVKYFNKKKVKTNYESIIGTVVKVTETVDNLNQTGAAVVEGKEWTVRTAEEGTVIEAGLPAVVVAIEGVKLIVAPYEEVKPN